MPAERGYGSMHNQKAKDKEHTSYFLHPKLIGEEVSKCIIMKMAGDDTQTWGKMSAALLPCKIELRRDQEEHVVVKF